MLKYIIVIFTFLISLESAVLNNLQKCDFVDIKCKQELYKNMAISLKSGDPVMGISPMDQVKIPGVSVTLPDSMELTLTDGLLVGNEECSSEYMDNNIEEQHSKFMVTCNLSINGKYKIKGGQDSVEGEGTGKILLDDVKFSVDIPYSVTRRDGEIYMTCNINEVIRSPELIGNVKFVSDDLGLGDKNSKIVSYLNDNSNVFKEVFLPLSVDKSLVLYLKSLNTLLNAIPVNNFIKGDVSSYFKI